MKLVFFTDRKKISDFEKVINGLPKNSVIIVREYDLTQSQRENFAKKIFTLARNNGLKVLIGKDIALAKKTGADGIHFSDLDKLPLQFFNKKSFPKNFIFSFSCHGLKSLLRIKNLKPNMIFIAPVFPTTSHENTRTFGLRNFIKIIVKNKNLLPIYPLGGINSQNLKTLAKLKIPGFGAIDYFLENL